MAVEAYPLTWPEGWKRCAPSDRSYGQFNKKETKHGTTWDNKPYSRQATVKLSVADGVLRILESLQKMGVDKQDVILSTNVRTRLDGMPRSGEGEPKDPGAAVYWQDKPGQPMRCMAIDRYVKVADNLAAIAATLEAMRAIERHGGAEILDRAFTGFNALPSDTGGESWWKTLGIEPDATEDQIQTAFRALARGAHEDLGGSKELMTKLNLAREQALSVARNRR